MSEEDFDLFRSEMGDVKPLKSSAKVRLRSQQEDALSKQARREAAQHFDEQGAAIVGPISVDYIEQVDVTSKSLHRFRQERGVYGRRGETTVVTVDAPGANVKTKLNATIR